jgi:adenine-specific DNA glycosylase
MRSEKLLGGLYVFVLLEGGNTPAAMEKHLRSLGIKSAYSGDKGNARHIFTHRIWNMRLMHYLAESEVLIKDYRWVSLAELSELPFPTAMKAALREAGKLLNTELL